MDNVVTIT